MRPIRGSDIAVFCRSNSRCAEVATALARVGVHVSLQRPGLLGTPEAMLALAALRYLVDPGDSLAIAEIAHLCEDYGDQPAWFERSLSDAGIRSLAAELPVLKSLDGARAELAELTPREALETAMTASGVLDRVHAWGNALDRVGNLDGLRGVATQYEEECRVLRSAATAAGLVSWIARLQSLAPELPPSTDPSAVHVLTYHRAKGLEWPMAILLDLHAARDPSAFGFTVENRGDFDVWAPLEGRWIRFWPWPYGSQRRNVHIDATARDTDEHRRAAAREHAESVRLLYVGMTRAKDYLVLAARGSVKKGLEVKWLDRLVDKGAKPVVDVSRLETGGVLSVGGTDVPVVFHGLAADDASPSSEDPQPVHRMPEVAEKSELPPYRIVPSHAAAAADPGASLVARIELGPRIPLSGNPDMAMLGEAVHAFLAGDRPDSDHSARCERAGETLSRWGVSGLASEDLVRMSDRLYSYLETECPGMKTRSEVPVFAKRDGQRLHGRVDLLLTDENRAIVIDHKSYPGAFDTWEARALGHAPQLALYAAAVSDATGATEVQTWVHLPIVGQLIRVRSEP